MRATGLKNWYTRRAKALSPGPPLRVTRDVYKEPTKIPRRLPEAPRWYSDAQRARTMAHKRCVSRRLKKLMERFRFGTEMARDVEEHYHRRRWADTNSISFTVTNADSSFQWVSVDWGASSGGTTMVYPIYYIDSRV